MRETLSYRGGYDFDWLQNGVVGAGDLLASAITLSSTSTGALTLTLAAGNAWVKDASGALLRLSRAADAGRVLTPGSLPATTKYAVVGVELDATGALSVVKGADTATQLNTAALIAANTPAVTAGRLRLADFAYWNNAGTINLSDHTTAGAQGTNWIDRRPWARGARARVVVTSGGPYSTTSTTLVSVTSNLQVRMELSGMPVKVQVMGLLVGGTSGTCGLAPLFDGSPTDGISGAGAGLQEYSGNNQYPGPAFDVVPPSAGSHLVSLGFCNSAGASVLFVATATDPLTLEVEEVLRQNASNGAV